MIKRLQDDPEHAKMDLTEIGPEMAREILDKHNNYIGQRALKPKVIKRYAKAIERGEFRTSVIAMMLGPSKEWQIADGQQRLSAVILSGLPIRVYIEHWTCDTEMELKSLYATFNVDAGRNARDLVKSMRDIYPPPMDGYPVEFLSNCATAAASTRNGNLDLGSLEDDRKDAKARLLHNYVKETVWLHSLYELACPERKAVMNVNVMSAMLLTRQTNSSLATEFWTPICSGEGLRRGTPQSVLANKIMDRDVFAKSSSGGNGRMANYVRFCVDVWNRWMSGKSVQGLKPEKTGAIPELLRRKSKSAEPAQRRSRA